MVQFTFNILFSLDRCLASLSSYARFVFTCSLLGQELLGQFQIFGNRHLHIANSQ